MDVDRPPELNVRSLSDADAAWRKEQLRAMWGSTEVARLGVLVDAAELDGFVAVLDDRRVGLLTYRADGNDVEVVTIQSDPDTVGVGRALMDAVADAAEARGASRLWLVTTDGNIRALGFYRRLGMHVAAIHVDGVARSRAVKPSIPVVDEHGSPLLDEIELELSLPRASSRP